MMPMQHRQSGSALLISLVLLVMLTLFVLTVINTTNINSRIAGNMQSQIEAQAAAQQAIEKVISTNFPANPALADEDVNVPIGNDKTYKVLVKKPQCVSVIPIKTTELNILVKNDAACLGSSVVGSAGIIMKGGPGAGAGDSLCSNTRWNVKAQVGVGAGYLEDSGVAVTVNQGVATRVAVGTPCPS